jgi:hypothetical protein
MLYLIKGENKMSKIILSDKETIEKLRDALVWLVYECNMDLDFDGLQEGDTHNCIVNAQKVLDQTEDY